ncbi:MAG: PAS domain-containing protein [Acidobacteria bacterium]|nr:PAS domain-containing protein [Acidobacteriota bacterium]
MSELAVSLLDNIPTAISVVRDDGSIVYRNNAFRECFGEGADEWMTRNSKAVAGERGWLQTFFAEKDHSIDLDYNGRVYHLERIPSVGGASQIALSFEDVTRQREAEQAKSDFTSMIVHDLRGPLSGIQGTLEFVLSQETARLDSLYEELLREASRESERMMGLINELLDFSKIESGNFEVGTDPIPIAGLLRRSVHSLNSIATRDTIHLVSAHGIDLPMLSGSEEKLTQAIINLISNSLKFTPSRGVISIGAQVVREGGGAKQHRQHRGDRHEHDHRSPRPPRRLVAEASASASVAWKRISFSCRGGAHAAHAHPRGRRMNPPHFAGG